MSKRKKRGHSPRTQPWWGKTKSEDVIAKKMERAIQGAAQRADMAAERQRQEAGSAKWCNWAAQHPTAAAIPAKETEYGPTERYRTWALRQNLRAPHRRF